MRRQRFGVVDGFGAEADAIVEAVAQFEDQRLQIGRKCIAAKDFRGIVAAGLVAGDPIDHELVRIILVRIDRADQRLRRVDVTHAKPQQAHAELAAELPHDAVMECPHTPPPSLIAYANHVGLRTFATRNDILLQTRCPCKKNPGNLCVLIAQRA